MIGAPKRITTHGRRALQFPTHSRPLSANARRDPTRTTEIRADYRKDLVDRFELLIDLINTTLVHYDALRLGDGGRRNSAPAINAIAKPVRRFQFTSDAARVRQFMKWLNSAITSDVLETTATNGRRVGRSHWQSQYVDRTYVRAVVRADTIAKRAGFDFDDHGVENTLNLVFNRPIHTQTLRDLYSRQFELLQGITRDMSTQIGEALAEGIALGRTNDQIAKAITDRVAKVGIHRAKLIARTEVINAHAEATLNRYGDFGVGEVAAQVEFATAGDDRVCEKCKGLDGQTYTLDEARGLIPVHPNCRCAWLPIVPRAPATPPAPQLTPQQLGAQAREKLAQAQQRYDDQYAMLDRRKEHNDRVNREIEGVYEQMKGLSSKISDIQNGRTTYGSKEADAQAIARLQAQKDAFYDQLDALSDQLQFAKPGEIKDLIEFQRRAVHVDNPGKARISVKTRSAGASRFKKAKGIFDKMVARGVWGEDWKVDIKGTTSKRAYHERLPLGQFSQIKLNRNSSITTAIHEMGHGLEASNPAILAASVRFIERRTQGESWQRMSDLTGSRFYRNDEVAKPDKFLSPYIGKRYINDQDYPSYGLNKGEWRSSEVVSMGLQYMYEDPAWFAEADPDHFDYIIAIMNGVIPD